MPTYQYACTECAHRFEQVQRFSDDALSQCPQCEGRLRKMFNAVGVVFKGSGFYRNDSRTDARGGNGTGAKDGGESSGSSESSSDTAGGSGTKDVGATTKQPQTSGSGANGGSSGSGTGASNASRSASSTSAGTAAAG